VGHRQGHKPRRARTDWSSPGLAAALEGETQVRIQLVVSDAACFDAALDDMSLSDATRFKARGR